MPTATYASDRMTELLNAATIALALTRTGNALPARSLRTHNEPVVPVTDCADSLSVYLANPAIKLYRFSGVVQGRGVQSGPVNVEAVLRLYVELWRCVPGLEGADATEPSDASLDTSAAGLARDIWALWTGLKQAQAAGTLFPGGFAQQLAEFGDPVPLGPLGRMGGWRILVEVPTSDIGPP